MAERAIRITAVAASAQLGGTERVLLDFAARAFEHDIALRVLTPRQGPLLEILNEIGVPAQAVPASPRTLRGSQRWGALASLPFALAGLAAWARRLGRHAFFQEADAIYTVAFKAHLAASWLRCHPVVWHLHEYPPALTGAAWRLLSRLSPDAMIANSFATARAWGFRPAGRPPYSAPGAEGPGPTAPDAAATSPLAPETGTPTSGRAPAPGAAGRLVVIENGVDLDRFRPRARTYWIHDALGVPREHRLIGMPAVFARWKGQIEAIRAFARIAPEFPGVHLVIAGGSIYDTDAERRYGGELEAAVRRAGAPVHLLPFQPKIELVYPELDLVVHYSLRPEPFGRVILEAMASGTPVMAAAQGGPVEILGGGEAAGALPSPPKLEEDDREGVQALPAGWLVPPRRVAALAQALRSALRLGADELRAKGQAGRRRAEDRYSARHFARRVADVLRGAVLSTPPLWPGE